VDEDDDAWRALIDAQHGVVTNQQAEEHGVTAAMIDHRVRNGVYQRLGEHTVATFAATPSREALEVAASLANPSGVLSHFSAARRHDLKAPDDGRVHISVPVKAPTGKGPRPGATRTLTVHRVRHLTDKDISERGGLRVTSLERTLIDLFGTLKRRDDRRALVAEAFRKRQTTLGRMQAAIRRMPQVRRRGELFYTLDLAAGGSHSAGEMRLYEFMHDWGFPTPDRQLVPQLPKGRRYVDCALPAYKIVLEYDGDLHLTDKQKHDDIMRDQQLRRLGWHTIRVTELRMRDERQLAVDVWADIVERAGALGVDPPPVPPRLG
jgi:hypothetical protein